MKNKLFLRSKIVQSVPLDFRDLLGIIMKKFTAIKFSACFGALLFACVPVFALDVAPFVFDGVNADDSKSQQEYWDNLVKYKLFATGVEDEPGITFEGQNVSITDENGYVGSAKGNFVMKNTGHKVGGPILFGGEFKSGDGNEEFVTGPVRFLKYFAPNFNSRGTNIFKGKYCFDAGYDKNNTEPGLTKGGGVVLSAEDCGKDDAVPFVETNLDVPAPKFATKPEYLPTVNASQKIADIQVPPEANGDIGVKDLFYEGISFSNNGKVFVVMPPAPGRLTRIFLEGSISGLGNTDGNDIRVVTARSNDQWDGTKWTNLDKFEEKVYQYVRGMTTVEMAKRDAKIEDDPVVLKNSLDAQIEELSSQMNSLDEDSEEFKNLNDQKNDIINSRVYTIVYKIDSLNKKIESISDEYNYDLVSNADYAGSLLIYTPKNLSIGASFKILQGSYISTGKIELAQNTSFAGQLLAKEISINANFDAKDFKFVPIDPPWIDFGDPKADSWGHLFEGKLDSDGKPVGAQNLVVSLSKPASNNVTFNYCFIFEGDKDKDKSDKNVLASSADIVDAYDFVECVDDNSQYKTAKFTAGSDTLDAPIRLEVFNDKIPEDLETFKIKIFDLSGAVLSNGTRTGTFRIDISDDDVAPIGKKDTIVVGYEDSDLFFAEPGVASKFPAKNFDGENLLEADGEFTVIIKTLPAVGSLKLNGTAVKVGDRIPSASFDKLSYLGAKDSFGTSYASFTYKLLNKDGVESFDAYKMTINLMPVNDAPVAHDTTFNFNENNTGVVSAAETIRVEDVDDTQFTYSFDPLASAYEKVNTLYTINATTGIVSTKEGVKLDYESDYSELTIEIIVKDVASTTGGSESEIRSSVITATIKVNNVNEAPSVVLPPSLTIKENSAVNTKVNGVISGTDPDAGTTLTYSMTDPSGLFKINSATGEISLEKATLDYEKTKSYTVKVSVSDGALSSSDVDAVIAIIDANDEPTLEASEFTIARSATKDDVVGTITGVDVDKQDTVLGLRYAFVSGGDEALFNIDPATGIITVKNDTPFLNKDKREYSVTVKVTDNDWEETGVARTGATASVTIKIDNTKPVIITEKIEIPEDLSKKDSVKATDADGDSVKYILKDDPSKKLVIDPISGEVSIKTGSSVNHESSDSSFVITVAVTDGLDTTEKKVTVKITDVNEKPTLADDGKTWTVSEHVKKGTEIGGLVGKDEDLTDVLTYSMTEVTKGASDIFVIDSKTGKVSVKDSVKLDFETLWDKAIYDEKTKALVYEVTITVTDREGQKASVNKKISVTDKNEYPVVTKKDFAVPENSVAGTVVDTVKASDPDTKNAAYGTLTYMLRDSDVPFVIDSKTGVVTVAKGVKLDYEVKDSYTLKVRVTDGSLNTDVDFVVKILNVNEPPQLVTKEVTVPEDSPVGSSVGKVEATDPENDKLIYKIVGGDSSVFAIDSITGTLKLKTPLDYETKSEYTIEVEVTDGEFTDKAPVKINIKDVIESSTVVVNAVETIDGIKSAAGKDTISIPVTYGSITVAYTDKNGKKTYKDSSFADLKDGCYEYAFVDNDKTINNPGHDAITICVSTKSPVVTVKLVNDKEEDPSGVTIVEGGDSQTSYVNTLTNKMQVITTDPLLNKVDTLVVDVKLDNDITIPGKVMTAVESIKNSLIPNEPKDASKITRTPENGLIAVSYEQVVNGETVTITHYETVDGKKVYDAEGTLVAKVSYQTVVGANTTYEKKVTVAYTIDYETGMPVIPAVSAPVAPGSKPSSESVAVIPGIMTDVTNAVYSISYEYADPANEGNVIVVSYGSDAKGNVVKNSDGDIVYDIAYVYTNEYGNKATNSIKVTLDTILPVVKILSPINLTKISAVSIPVIWTVNGVEQDTLNLQSLEKGWNFIIRTYRDKAGNEASDTVRVNVTKPKNVTVAAVTPVAKADEKVVAAVQEYYANNPQAEGSRYSISILQPKKYNEETGKPQVVEVLNGSNSGSKPNTSGYSRDEDVNIGPTFKIDIKMPSVSATGGLATIDDIVLSNGLISLDSANAGWKSEKLVTVDEYLNEHCSAEFTRSVDRGNLSKSSLYKVKYKMHVWIFSSLATFVDEFSFDLDLDNEVQVDEGGVLSMYFGMTPDRDGALRTSDGRLLGTGAYLFKTEIRSTAVLQCDLPGVIHNTAGTKKGTTLKEKEDSLIPFGYKRPLMK